MYIDVELEPGAIKPTKAHDADGGFDFYSREERIIPARSSTEFNTGVHISIPKGLTGLLVSKSGLNVKHSILSTGLIDAQYTGAVVVKLYNEGLEDYKVSVGDKISQLVLLPIPSVTLRQVEKLDIDSDRGDKGFGSSGK